MNVMKYILFLFCILFFNLSALAEDETASADNIRINLGNYKSNSGTDSDPFSLNTPPDFSFANTSGTMNFGGAYCSSQNLNACKTQYFCMKEGGHWDYLSESCKRASCHFGTTADMADPEKCICNGETFAYVERGNFLQSCPVRCQASENKSYAFFSRSCVCNDGFTMATNGACVANRPAQTAPNISECWRELAEKATACETAADTAVAECEPGENDSLQALQGLLAGTSGSAIDNCERAATASTSGYHHVEDTRRVCDEKINSCKTGCVDATAFLNANKARVYNACRERAYQAQIQAGPPLPQDRFNPMWDNDNKANLDSQFQSLLTKIESSRATCETGTAAKNREELSTAMNEMNTSSRNANQCVCQLGSTSADCAKSVVGPADCSADPSRPGCTAVADNCFDANNVSLKCICFRNPESAQCKGSANLNVKANEMDASGFAAKKNSIDTRSNNSEVSGMAAGKTTEGFSNIDNAGQKPEIYAQSELISEAASGSTISSAGNTGGEKSAVAAASASSGGAGNVSKSANPSPATAKNNVSVGSKLSGFFNTAKSAIGGIFKKGSGSKESSDDYRDGSNPSFDQKKFRPRGMVRGIASVDGLAGKHEDIWKVMNKQYKVQDQKDNFIFEK